MTSRTITCVYRVAVGISACLSGLFGIIWLASLFYYASFAFPLPAPFEVTRLEAGYGMIYLTVNDEADPRSRWNREGILEFPNELRNENIRQFLRFEFPTNHVSRDGTAFGYFKREIQYRRVDTAYSNYWCSAPIPCMLFFVVPSLAFVRWRRSCRRELDNGQNAEQRTNA